MSAPSGLALAAALAATALPEGTARWRFELGGEHVGVVSLAVRCGAARCAVTWTSDRRAPADAGGRRTTRRVALEVDREGRWRGGPIRVEDDGGRREAPGFAGAIPSLLAEVLLAAPLAPSSSSRGEALVEDPYAVSSSSRGEACLEAFDETSGLRGVACGRRDGDAIAATVLGTVERVVPGADGFPARIELPSQGARFARDDAATLPRRAPRLYGTAVDGPPDPRDAAAFCGVPRDPDPPAQAPGALPPFLAVAGGGRAGDGASCRERTAAWLARARRAGLAGRTAVGVAWDGARFAWHAWAEVKLARGWLPVDPTFEQLPARGPRFTVATYPDADPRALRRAGERILACWGRERVR